MTAAILLNLIFAIPVLAMIVVLVARAIAAQPRDRGITLARRATRPQRAWARPRIGGGDVHGREAWPAS